MRLTRSPRARTRKYAARCCHIVSLALIYTFCAPLLQGQQVELVEDIYPGAGGSSPAYMTVLNSTIYFRAYDPQNGDELWKSDGSPTGTTQIVSDIYTGANGSGPYPATWSQTGWDYRFVIVNDRLYFRANEGSYGDELYWSDGTNSGTQRIADIYSGGTSSGIAYMTKVGNTVCMRARDSSYGYEMWRATGGSVSRVTDIYSGSSHGYCNYITDINGDAWCSGRHSSYGYEPYRITSGNSVNLVRDIYSGSSSSSPVYFTELNGYVYFRAQTQNDGYELWRADTNGNNCALFEDIRPGTNSSYPEYLTKAGNLIFFRAEDDSHGNELWVTDGTSNGTRMVKDINTSGSSDLYGLTAIGSKVYFICYTPEYGYEIWESDGTEAGTKLVHDVYPGPNSSSPDYLSEVNGSLYFGAEMPDTGRELWKVLPTGGARLVSDLRPGPNSSSPQYMVYMNGYCYFSADDGQNGRELFRVAIPPEVIGTMPSVNSTDAALDTNITISNSQDVVTASVDATSFVVNGRLSGFKTGQYGVNQMDTIFDPDVDFQPGETIEVTLTGDFENSFAISSGSPYVFRFQANAMAGPAVFDSVLLNPIGGSTAMGSAVAAGDVDGDGDIDLVFAISKGQNYVAFNNGMNGFASVAAFGGASTDSRDVQLADLDNDEDLDIIVVNYEGENAVFLNDGQGGFSTRIPFGPGNDLSTSLSIGDMNGDGALDLVVSNFTQQNLVLFNDGSARFNLVNSFGTGFDDTVSVATGDIDGDGKLDIVVANRLNPGRYYLNDGQGSFSGSGAERDYGAGVLFASAVAVGDLDNDGDLDIVSANSNRKNVVFWNGGAGSFTSMPTELPNFDPSRDVALGDFNGDDYLDIAFANFQDQNEVYLNDQMGGFTGTNSPVNFGTGGDATVGLCVADFDGDLDLDLALATSGGQSVIAPNQVSVPTPAQIVSTAVDTATVGVMYQYTVLTTGVPAATLTMSGNPAWLTRNGNVLSGTPAQSDLGVSSLITLEANNGVGAADVQQFSITVNPAPSAPSFTSTAVLNAAVGQQYVYSLMADGFPTPTFTASGLPAWLTLNGATLSGTASTSDIGTTADITLRATNGVGADATQVFQIVVSLEEAPAITSQPVLTATVGVQYTYAVTASGAPAPNLNASGLPAWLNWNGNVLTGIPNPSDAGTSGIAMTGTIVISADNGVGQTAVQSFTITITDPAKLSRPRVVSTPGTTAFVGQEYRITVQVAGSPAPTASVSALPSWLSYDDVTMIISGTPTTADIGITAPITIRAENSLNQSSEIAFEIIVVGLPEGASTTSSDCALQSGGTSNSMLLLLLSTFCAMLLLLRRKPSESN